MFCSFLAIFHAAFVFSLASLPGIARHACATLVTTLFATVRLLRLRSNSSAASHTTNQQSYCDDTHFIALLFALYPPPKSAQQQVGCIDNRHFPSGWCP